jgi:hypothetical protein
MIFELLPCSKSSKKVRAVFGESEKDGRIP